jgi:hypothetical protein
MKKQLIQHLASKLNDYGFDVYVSKDGRCGFYTNRRRVVSFGGQWNFSVDFSGNYAPTRESGTGWQIATEKSDITEEEAAQYIRTPAPYWANKSPVYTTPEQYLKTHGKSSGFTKFNQEVTA